MNTNEIYIAMTVLTMLTLHVAWSKGTKLDFVIKVAFLLMSVFGALVYFELV